MFKKCNRRCDICKSFPVVSTQFTCHAMIACKWCSKQYIGSATCFKERFRIDKCDIDTGKMISPVKWYRRYRMS